MTHSQIPQIALENKAVSSQEMAGAFDDFMYAFEDFKKTNDDRLDQLENRKSVDILTEEKLERINNALDELSIKAARPQLGTAAPALNVQAAQHKSAFEGYVRKGAADGLQALEAKSLSVGADPDGGYLVPEQTEHSIMRAVKDLSPMRAICGVRQVSTTSYKKPFSVAGPGAGWVGETDSRPQTTSPTLAELNFPTMELYAMPAATASLLDDSAVNIDQWIADEVRQAFAEQEGTAFVSGDGINKPKGFLSYNMVAQDSWSWGNLGTVATGADGTFDAAAPSDNLIDLVYSLKAAYRANSHFMMNRATLATIRKLKDADGNYLWQPPAQPGGTSSLFHFPIAESEDMPDIASDSTAIAFGDFARGYLIVDRVGIRVLRDPYSSKPYVLFYTTKRVGGGVQDFDAIKLLKFGI